MVQRIEIKKSEYKIQEIAKKKTYKCQLENNYVKCFPSLCPDLNLTLAGCDITVSAVKHSNI